MEIDQKVLGPNHPAVGIDLNNLALLNNREGKYAEAERLYGHALAIKEQALGPNHSAVATSLSNLAGLYNSQGKYAEAEPLYRRALEIDGKALGSNHPRVATDLNNLTALYDSQGKFAEALPLYKSALEIDEKALGPNHPDVAANLSNLAGLYGSQGNSAKPSRSTSAHWRSSRSRWELTIPMLLSCWRITLLCSERSTERTKRRGWKLVPRRFARGLNKKTLRIEITRLRAWIPMKGSNGHEGAQRPSIELLTFTC